MGGAQIFDLYILYVQIKNNLKLHSSIKSCNSIDLIQLTTADCWFLLLVSDVFLLYFTFTLHAILFLSSHSFLRIKVVLMLRRQLLKLNVKEQVEKYAGDFYAKQFNWYRGMLLNL